MQKKATLKILDLNLDRYLVSFVDPKISIIVMDKDLQLVILNYTIYAAVFRFCAP